MFVAKIKGGTDANIVMIGVISFEIKPSLRGVGKRGVSLIGIFVSNVSNDIYNIRI